MVHMHHTKHAMETDFIREISDTCVLMRTRLIARVVTALHDESLQAFGVGAAQFVLLVVIGKLEPVSRAAIGRFHRQDRSTLSRNLKVILAQGWAQEDASSKKGRIRPLILTGAGRDLLMRATPAWRVAQAKARALLGQSGAEAVIAVADRILAETAPD